MKINESMRERDLKLHSFVTECLEAERNEVLANLATAQSEARFKLRLRLWVLEGVLTNGFSMDLLTEVADKYERIKILPCGYL